MNTRSANNRTPILKTRPCLSCRITLTTCLITLTACGNNNTPNTQTQTNNSHQYNSSSNTPVQKQPPQNSHHIITSFAPVVRNASPAVVNIYSSKTHALTSPFATHPFFDRFFGQPKERINSSLGSGVIVGVDGIIVTNHHVINNASHLRIVLPDRREFVAKTILSDQRADLAVLKINAGEHVFPILQFADTRSLEVGDLVLAIGNPFGVGQTVTSGIVSALARTDVGASDYAFFIQTDAAINPGNSGGALVDIAGNLVGINTAIYSRSGGSNGIGFAIPAEMVQRVVNAAIKGGTVQRPWLGLKGQDVNAQISLSLGLDRPVGMLITDVYPNGPADKAGLKPGDLITAIDDREIFGQKGLRFIIATRTPRQKVILDVISDHIAKAVSVQLDTPPASHAGPQLLSGPGPLAGVAVSDLSPSLAENFGLDPFANGVVLVSVPTNSHAANIGLRHGDVLTSLNGNTITHSSDLLNTLQQQPHSQKNWNIAFLRNGQTFTLNARF